MITCLPPGGAEISPSARLGKGELAVIAAARQFGCPALMDDQLARRAALQRGVQVVGSAGILLAATKRGIIPAIAPVLLAWREGGYYLAPGLVAAVLDRGGEGT